MNLRDVSSSRESAITYGVPFSQSNKKNNNQKERRYRIDKDFKFFSNFTIFPFVLHFSLRENRDGSNACYREIFDLSFNG